MGIKFVMSKKGKACPHCKQARNKSLLVDGLFFGAILLIFLTITLHPELLHPPRLCPCTNYDLIWNQTLHNLTNSTGVHF